ncbi:MAG TPA: Crp/Fnr family transcriptional regulator [Kiloniellaceae bacterium]|nr:Crp/Fnr family transcriptional regulator [Kiloniellaceae bacterium]
MAQVSGHLGCDIEDLAAISVFRDLPQAVCSDIAALCRKRRVPAGEMIVADHDASSDVHFLLAGRARALIYAHSGKAVIFQDIPAGGFFGELAAIDGRRRSATVEALDDCDLLLLPAPAFRDLLARHSAFAELFLTHLVSEVRRLSNRVVEFRTLAVQHRIHAELLRLTKGVDADGDRALIAPAPTLAEIADRVSTHREAVSRELSRLAKLDLLQRTEGGLLVKRLSRLEEMVRDAKGE